MDEMFSMWIGKHGRVTGRLRYVDLTHLLILFGHASLSNLRLGVDTIEQT